MGLNYLKERCELIISIIENKDGFILKRDLEYILQDKLNLRLSGVRRVIYQMQDYGIIHSIGRINPTTKKMDYFVYLQKNYFEKSKVFK